jgi:hypothetical protein
MRFINRDIPIAEVARALELRFDCTGKIHCWHPERHKHGDRTASVGIRRTNNTVKCFGCDSKPTGPIDLVMDVQQIAAADAALWIAQHFDVPMIPAGKRLEEAARLRTRFGHERGLELLIRSGLWGTLSEASRSIAPVLQALSEKTGPSDERPSIRISYVKITRFSGVKSPNSIRKALHELEEVGFLTMPEAGLGRSPSRQASLYVVTPNSETLVELAHAFATQMRVEIAAEQEIRRRLRKERISAQSAQVSARLGGARGLRRRPLAPHPHPRFKRKSLRSGSQKRWWY